MSRSPLRRIFRNPLAPISLVALAAGSLGAALGARAEVAAPACAKCRDIPKLERELAQQKLARDAFREFTYDAVGRRQHVGSVKELQTAHARLFSQLASGGKKGGKGGRVVAKPALETDLNDCSVYEVLPNGKKVPLDEEKYRKKLCLFADFLIEHEKDHVRRCKRAKAEGLTADFENPIVIAELEMRGYQAGIELLEAQLASLKAGCFVASSGVAKPTDRALALGLPDAPAVDAEAKRIGAAIRKGWS